MQALQDKQVAELQVRSGGSRCGRVGAGAVGWCGPGALQDKQVAELQVRPGGSRCGRVVRSGGSRCGRLGACTRRGHTYSRWIYRVVTVICRRSCGCVGGASCSESHKHPEASLGLHAQCMLLQASLGLHAQCMLLQASLGLHAQCMLLQAFQCTWHKLPCSDTHVPNLVHRPLPLQCSHHPHVYAKSLSA